VGAVPGAPETAGAVETSPRYSLGKLTDELQLNAGLRKYSKGIFLGDTHYNQRLKKARAIIKEFALEKEKLLGHSYRWWFVRCYGEEP